MECSKSLRTKIICLHDITDEKPKNEWTISRKYLIQLLDLIKLDTENKYEIHFDDARIGVYKYAFELLKPVINLGKITSTIFVVPNWASGYEIPDHERYSEFMNWSQLQEMHAAGFEIGSHTLSHNNLLFMDGGAKERELRLSKAIIEGKLGCAVRKLAYPYGAMDVAVEDAAMRVYEFAYQLNRGLERNNWTLKRTLVLGGAGK